MAGVRLEFTQRGHFDYFNIYRNSVSTEIVDLNQPLATCKTMYYVDLTVVQSQKYYYRIGIVRGNEEIFSDELIVSTSAIKSYRYLRIYITANNGDEYTSLQEIEIASVLDGSDVTTPSTPSNQSSYFEMTGAIAANIVSNNFIEYQLSVWVTSGTPTPHWVSFDLAEIRELAELRIWPQNYEGGAARAPKDFIIQGSNDNLTWNDIKAFNGVSGWIAGVGKTFNLVTGIVT